MFRQKHETWSFLHIQGTNTKISSIGTSSSLLTMTCQGDINSCWKSFFVLASINHMLRKAPPICICGDIYSLNSLREWSFDVSGHPCLTLAHAALQRSEKWAELSFNASLLQLLAWSREVRAGEVTHFNDQCQICKILVLLPWKNTLSFLDFFSTRMKNVQILLLIVFTLLQMIKLLNSFFFTVWCIVTGWAVS